MATKAFKVAALSKNANSFGLYGHVLIAKDGEAWEVARCNGHSGNHVKVGDIILVPQATVIPENNIPHVYLEWARLSFELPRRLTNAPAKVLADVWPDNLHG